MRKKKKEVTVYQIYLREQEKDLLWERIQSACRKIRLNRKITE